MCQRDLPSVRTNGQQYGASFLGTQMAQEVRLRLVLVDPLPGVDYGVQKGKGRDYETVAVQRGGGPELALEFSILFEKKECGLVFRGPFAQGPPRDRFVYVDIGKMAGQTDCGCSARIKVPLGTLSRSLVSRAERKDNAILEARIPGDSTGTTHPLSEWRLTTSDENDSRGSD